MALRKSTPLKRESKIVSATYYYTNNAPHAKEFIHGTIRVKEERGRPRLSYVHRVMRSQDVHEWGKEMGEIDKRFGLRRYYLVPSYDEGRISDNYFWAQE